MLCCFHGSTLLSTGTISFGLVTVPVRLYAAGESAAAVSFNLLHGKCGSRLKQQYVCPKDEEIVPRDQMVKGYEFAKDQYVTFTEDEIKAMAEESSKTIEITEFVPMPRSTPSTSRGPTTSGPTRAARRPTSSWRRPCGRPAARPWPSGRPAASST